MVICADYQIFPERIDRETIFTLRDSISTKRVRAINERSRNFPAVAFYVHGFRKSYISRNGDVTSAEEFRLLKANLATYGKPQALEIEVYWDGMYDCCFSATANGTGSFFNCTRRRLCMRKPSVSVYARSSQVSRRATSRFSPTAWVRRPLLRLCSTARNVLFLLLHKRMSLSACWLPRSADGPFFNRITSECQSAITLRATITAR